MLYLKQSTASQTVLLGPYIDKSDGSTAETGLTVANTDIRLSANGGNMFSKTSGGGTHDEAGWYAITLDATDTATVGTLQVSSHITADALPVFAEFQVLEENVYDAWFASSAAAGTDLAAILVDTAEIGTAGAGLSNIDLPNQTMDITGNLSGSVGSVTGAVGSVAGNVDGSVGSNVELGPAEVNAEVVDVMATDTIAELAQAAPAATPTHRTAIMALYMALRNKLDVTSSVKEVHNDAGTVIFKKDLTDDGTTYSEAETASGP